MLLETCGSWLQRSPQTSWRRRLVLHGLGRVGDCSLAEAPRRRLFGMSVAARAALCPRARMQNRQAWVKQPGFG